MRLLTAIGFALLVVTGCGTGEKESKRKKPPILQSRIKWMTSYADAATKSKETGKPTSAFFTGSDWCKYCQLLDYQNHNTEAFATWAKKNVILLEIDLPNNKKIDPEIMKVNVTLRDQYRVTGFPTILLLRFDGTPLLKAGYEQVPAERWIEVIDQKLKESMARLDSEKPATP